MVNSILMHTNLCILIEISMKTRMAKIWKAIDESCKFPFSMKAQMWLHNGFDTIVAWLCRKSACLKRFVGCPFSELYVIILRSKTLLPIIHMALLTPPRENRARPYSTYFFSILVQTVFNPFYCFHKRKNKGGILDLKFIFSWIHRSNFSISDEIYKWPLSYYKLVSDLVTLKFMLD